MENSLEDLKTNANDLTTSEYKNDGDDGDTSIDEVVVEEAEHEVGQSSTAFHHRALVSDVITASNYPDANMALESTTSTKFPLPRKDEQCWSDSNHERVIGDKEAITRTKIKERDGVSQASCHRKGRWDGNEHDLFIIAHYIYGKQWQKVSSLIQTRTAAQVKNHAQKYFDKVRKQLVLRKDIDKKKGASWRINYATTIPDDELSLVALSFMKGTQGWTPKTREQDLRAKTIVNKFINNRGLGDDKAVQSLLGYSQTSPSIQNRQLNTRQFLRRGQMLDSFDANHAAGSRTQLSSLALPQAPFSVSSIQSSHDSRWTDYVQSILSSTQPNPSIIPPEIAAGTSFGTDAIGQQSREGGSAPGISNIAATSRVSLPPTSVNHAALFPASPSLTSLAPPSTSGFSLPLPPQGSLTPEMSTYRYNRDTQQSISNPLYAASRQGYDSSHMNECTDNLQNPHGQQSIQWSVAQPQPQSQSQLQSHSQSQPEHHDRRNTNENTQEQSARFNEYESLLQQQRLLQQQSSELQACEDLYIALLQRDHGLDLRSDRQRSQNNNPTKDNN